jgi:hypothetical protein
MAYCERCASSVITRMCGLGFSSGNVSFRSVSRNLWIMAITRSEVLVLSNSFRLLPLGGFSGLMLSATFTVKPMLWLVSLSWSSSWVRSVTKTTFHLESWACRYISRTMNIMVSDLPEPWVCQMMPLRSRGVCLPATA